MFMTSEQVASYVLAGNATFTLRSKKTRAHYTYQLSKPADKKNGNMYFVGLLTGPNNEADYTYVGLLDGRGFRFTKKSKLTTESMAVRGFLYFYNQVLVAGKMPSDLEVAHCGSCGRCGRKLTVPESIALGIGPECADKMGLVMPKLTVLTAKANRPVVVVADMTQNGIQRLPVKPKLRPIWDELNDDIPDLTL